MSKPKRKENKHHMMAENRSTTGVRDLRGTRRRLLLELCEEIRHVFAAYDFASGGERTQELGELGRHFRVGWNARSNREMRLKDFSKKQNKTLTDDERRSTIKNSTR